ncbi:hypothetical protein FMEXI_13328 [Fusarium mexicanum]|uniref:Uncharacterized protein n=1 Tax=Fusarium mexicanum TaxID=751941 RepID=A0A8H5I5P7_9HYPO|nr:hypothetical protein FMEXI_13328 [Fusarium mexicanum]
MAASNPFDQLPAELMTTILATFTSPEDVHSIIRADPQALRVFLQHKKTIVPSLRRNLYHESCGQSLVQATMIYRLRKNENVSQCETRPQAVQVMKPVLTSPPERFREMKLSLGALRGLYQPIRESRNFRDYYHIRASEMHFVSSATRRKQFRLLNLDSGQFQKAYLLFEAYRHTLSFSTNLLQDYGTDDDGYDFHIPLNFIYQDKLLCVWTFQTFFVFLFREYENLLSRVESRISISHYLYRFDSDWCIQRREFLYRGQRDRLQFTAYLSSQGCLRLLNIQYMDDIAQEEHISSLYMRYLELKADRQTCPMVVVLILNTHSGHFAQGGGKENYEVFTK